MLQLISNLIRNQNFQDAASVARGIYRISQGLQDPFSQSLFHEKQIQNIGDDEASQPELRKQTPKNIENNNPQQTPQSQIEEQNQNVVEREQITPKISKDALQDAPQGELQQQKGNLQFTENKVPESAWSRAFQFGVLGFKLASSTAYTSITTGANFKDAVLSESNADLLSRSLCKMRGAPLKLAQALSIQEDKLIPESVRQAFEKARQTADIMPKSQLEGMIRKELGSDWVSKFEHFDFQPFAAASIGQVHRGMIQGKEVAVKVQYPGVRESVDSDMNNLKRIMTYTDIFPKHMFLDKLLENTKKELYEECDYIKEAQKQLRYKQMLSEDTYYLVPDIYRDFSTRRILTAEYIQGEQLDTIAMTNTQELRNLYGAKLMELTLRELFQYRFMQTDPNPSNFYCKNGKIVLLDFGAAREYDKEFINNYIEIIYGAAVNNRELCLQKSITIGFLTGEESLRMKDAHVDSILAVGEPFSFNGSFDFGIQEITDKVYKLMPIMFKYRLKPPPSEVYSLHRKLSGAYLMNMKLKSKVNCRDIFMKLYQEYKLKQN